MNDRTRLQAAVARLQPQATDPGVWDNLAAEYADLTPARSRANRALLGEWVEPCCDLHNVHCEPPSELCCYQCAEAAHPEHPRGVRCVLEAAAKSDRPKGYDRA
ncbi:hypothetical protein AB0I89_24220 [Micromonospora sp. NPDC049801]|uniref:hypothetical protein n=1 Tax=unclassified Micromonospora TaxID=2617518 RepID=UPI0033FC4CF3